MLDPAGASARTMLRRALKAALATRDAETGAPYASMVLLATTVDGSPVTLISGLARHTRNLIADGAASLLIDTSNAAGDTTSGGRVSLMGRFTPTTDPAARARFIARHTSAAEYAGFGDFGFWQMAVASAHLIEGFGRIVPLSAAALRPAVADYAKFAAAEPRLTDELRRRWPGVTGFDPEGVDLVEGGAVRRLGFPASIGDPTAAAAAAANCLAAHDPSA